MKSRHQKVQLPFKEGTWFAVPLAQSGYALGRVGRHSPEGDVILGYFFGPKRRRVPTLDEVEHLEPNEAVAVFCSSELGIMDGTWPIIGNSRRWERERWPIPGFVRRDPISRTAWRVIYSESDPSTVVAEERIPYEAVGLQPDRYSGHKAAEIHLSRILG